MTILEDARNCREKLKARLAALKGQRAEVVTEFDAAVELLKEVDMEVRQINEFLGNGQPKKVEPFQGKLEFPGKRPRARRKQISPGLTNEEVVYKAVKSAGKFLTTTEVSALLPPEHFKDDSKSLSAILCHLRIKQKVESRKIKGQRGQIWRAVS